MLVSVASDGAAQEPIRLQSIVEGIAPTSSPLVAVLRAMRAIEPGAGARMLVWHRYLEAEASPLRGRPAQERDNDTTLRSIAPADIRALENERLVHVGPIAVATACPPLPSRCRIHGADAILVFNDPREQGDTLGVQAYMSFNAWGRDPTAIIVVGFVLHRTRDGWSIVFARVDGQS